MSPKNALLTVGLTALGLFGVATRDVDGGGGRIAGGVQSIARAFDLLETMADLGGIVTLCQLATRSGTGMPPSLAEVEEPRTA